MDTFLQAVYLVVGASLAGLVGLLVNRRQQLRQQRATIYRELEPAILGRIDNFDHVRDTVVHIRRLAVVAGPHDLRQTDAALGLLIQMADVRGAAGRCYQRRDQRGGDDYMAEARAIRDQIIEVLRTYEGFLGRRLHRWW